MKSKTITKVLFGVIIIFFFLTISSKYLYFNKIYNFNNELIKIIELGKDDKWDEAKTNYMKVMGIWKIGKLLINMNYSEEDVTDLNTEFADLGTAVETKDINALIKSIRQIQEHIANIDRIIPGP